MKPGFTFAETSSAFDAGPLALDYGRSPLNRPRSERPPVAWVLVLAVRRARSHGCVTLHRVANNICSHKLADGLRPPTRDAQGRGTKIACVSNVTLIW